MYRVMQKIAVRPYGKDVSQHHTAMFSACHVEPLCRNCVRYIRRTVYGHGVTDVMVTEVCLKSFTRYKADHPVSSTECVPYQGCILLRKSLIWYHHVQTAYS